MFEVSKDMFSSSSGGNHGYGFGNTNDDDEVMAQVVISMKLIASFVKMAMEHVEGAQCGCIIS